MMNRAYETPQSAAGRMKRNSIATYLHAQLASSIYANSAELETYYMEALTAYAKIRAVVACTTRTQDVVNLYGEDGIVIGINADNDICEPESDDAIIRVIGHAAYACSFDEAANHIRRAYLKIGVLTT